MRLDEGYIAQALQDARRFQGAWTGTSGTLAAHTHRLITERQELVATIHELERQNAELRAAVQKRISSATPVPDDVPEAFAATLQNVTLVPATPTPAAEFKPTLVNATLPAGQLQAAWAAVSEKARTASGRTEPIETVRVDTPRQGPRIVGLAGRAGAGKTTAASMVPGAAVIQLADPLYAALAALLGVTESVLRNRAYKSAPLPGIGKSPRQLLQTLGTEWGRQIVAEDIWIKMAEKSIERLAASGVTVVAIADVRFDNEADWIRRRGGQVWHVYRNAVSPDEHSSESGVSRHQADILIDNTGELHDLRRAVKAAFAA